jgi:O-antigen/teichoic acid export membrane protein
MGKELKTLVKDTAIYGLSSIVGRFLNYLLVPLHTTKIIAESGGYGVVSNVYAYTALLMALLTFGMETTFFRFSNKEGEDERKVYGTTLWMVGGVSLLFALLCFVFNTPISAFMGYADHPEYIACMTTIVAFDALQSILFARLRGQHRPVKFMVLKLSFIILSVLLNLFIFLGAPAIFRANPELLWWYRPEDSVGYIFAINLICTVSVTFGFLPELKGFTYGFDRKLALRMLRYALPILVLSIAGILNQVADKITYRFIVPGTEGDVQLGIYGACTKIAMIMALLTQAFRYAYEPFVFGKSRDKDNRTMYATTMKYFIIFTLLAFLCVVGYMDILKHIIGADYHEGLKVVPIVMAAEIMMGIYFNLSFWYKLIDKTIWGAWFSIAGCLVLVAVNIIFIPRYGYMACAWGGFAGYATSMLLSYFVGQKKYPVKYPLKSIGVYVFITILFFVAMSLQPDSWHPLVRMGINTVLILLFVAHIIHHDLPLKPILDRLRKRNA